MTARWVEGDDPQMLKKFTDENKASLAEDHDGCLVFLARNDWHLNKAIEDWPKLRFQATREQTV